MRAVWYSRRENHVTQDRRKHGRSTQALEGAWRGASGGTRCRIGDFSLGGCFVQSLALPEKDERTMVTLTVGGREVTLPGVVVYVEPGMGFAVQFKDLSDDQRGVLNELIQATSGSANAS